jgi:DnaJ-domain-containing protein 1
MHTDERLGTEVAAIARKLRRLIGEVHPDTAIAERRKALGL